MIDRLVLSIQIKKLIIDSKKEYHGEFDPGSGWTLAVCLTHASRTRIYPSGERVRNMWESALERRITFGNEC